MSWDVLILYVPPEIETAEQMGDDFHSELGPRDRVLERLRGLFPEIDLSDPTWGDLEGPSYSIEFNIGDKDPVESIMLHVRGDDGSIDPIHRLCEATGWRAMDMGDCEFLDFDEDPARGLRGWQGLRDQMMEEVRARGREGGWQAVRRGGRSPPAKGVVELLGVKPGPPAATDRPGRLDFVVYEAP